MKLQARFREAVFAIDGIEAFGLSRATEVGQGYTLAVFARSNNAKLRARLTATLGNAPYRLIGRRKNYDRKKTGEKWSP